jgi:hypothetical protein
MTMPAIRTFRMDGTASRLRSPKTMTSAQIDLVQASFNAILPAAKGLAVRHETYGEEAAA